MIMCNGRRARRVWRAILGCSSMVFLSLLTVFSAFAYSQEKAPLRLVATIPMPNIQGRIDHMDVDVEGKRLFIATTETGSMEVVDLGAGKWLRSIPGFKTPTEMCYVRELNKLFVANRDDGMVRIFRGDSLDLIDSIKLELGGNRIVYDPVSKYVYVGYGAKFAGFDYGRVGIIDARSDKLLGDMVVEGHPSQILLDNAAHRILVAVWEFGRIYVFDARNRETVLTCTTGGLFADMALDQTHHRLFAA